MSFLTAMPEELLAAAAQLEGDQQFTDGAERGCRGVDNHHRSRRLRLGIGAAGGIFSTYGTLYQQIAAEAQTIQQQFTSTLGLSSGSYTATEAVNAAAAGPAAEHSQQLSARSSVAPPQASMCWPVQPVGQLGNLLNIGGGNWASAASDLLGMAGGGLLATDAGDAAAGSRPAGRRRRATAGRHGGMGAMA